MVPGWSPGCPGPGSQRRQRRRELDDLDRRIAAIRGHRRRTTLRIWAAWALSSVLLVWLLLAVLADAEASQVATRARQAAGPAAQAAGRVAHGRSQVIRAAR